MGWTMWKNHKEISLEGTCLRQDHKREETECGEMILLADGSY